MEKEQRTALRSAVVTMRRLLEKDFQEQLEGTFNILPDGRILEGAPGDPVVRARLLDVLQHHCAGGATPPEAVDRVVREAAFTILNRFAALKMAEQRHLVRECVSQGIESAGIRELAECAPGLHGAVEDGGYRLLLDAVKDEISLDLKVLFNRRDSMAPLWPGPKALDDLLETLNFSDLADVWAEDEAIGWIYQYFNDNDVKEMRDAAKGGAPRNSRELSVRNQFFTPRYVVEFLTDNTLGRLWYEMTCGKTVLREHCRYLVRRPTEIFLKPDESAPVSTTAGDAGAGETLSQAKLLRRPVYIPHRPLKDPRDIRLLDPACGSMHFGLYAFDLFTVIYEEAWEIAHGQDDAAKSPATFAPFVRFAANFPDKAAFLREVPCLVIERNIHGIDIDPRAVQIAGLSLWLRAQRAWHQARVKPADRPRITRSKLVCAEPMPGEMGLLREFVEQQFPIGERPAFAFLLERIFDRMTLAGEAGSLLRIEEEIRIAIADAMALWAHGPLHEQAPLLPEVVQTPKQGALRLDLSGITDEQFWERAEQRIYDALKAYAEQAEDGGGFQRRLFAADAAQGFAFIDLCRKRYDVMVMNPPFGEFSKLWKDQAKKFYPRSSNDILAAFVERGICALEPSGFVGAITSRTCFFLLSFQAWREQVILKSALPTTIADLGHGVMDSAMVEAAAYVLTSSTRGMPVACARLLKEPDKREPLLQSVHAIRENQTRSGLFLVEPREFQKVPGSPFCYWVGAHIRDLFVNLPPFDSGDREAKQGLATGDDFRFARAWWEVQPSAIVTLAAGSRQEHYKKATQSRVSWCPFAKGGAFSPFYQDLALVVRWTDDGHEIRNFTDPITGSELSRYRGAERYFEAGFTYADRASSRFCPRLLPEGAVISVKGSGIYCGSGNVAWSALAVLNSLIFTRLMDLLLGTVELAKSYQVNTVGRVPWPIITLQMMNELGAAARDCWNLTFSLDRSNLTSHAFVTPAFAHGSESLEQRQSNWQRASAESRLRLRRIQSQIDQIALRGYGLSEADFAATEQDTSQKPSATEPDAEITDGEVENGLLVESFLDFTLGTVFGRWDIRYATSERPSPELPDPFAPLPVCPPGMLQSDDGLPLSPEAGRQTRAEGRYPLDVAWDGILVDDPGHPLDLERRVHAALTVLWGDAAEVLKQEACALLGVPTLREWFRRPAGFFADHLKRYSKSRRQAPIYWPLSTASGSYTIWVYYHRLTADTVFQLAEHVELKLGKTRDERLRAAAGQAKTEGRESASLAKKAGELIAVEQELEEMKAEFLRVAALPYRPDLNDGVQITAAPLWKLFRLSKWRKELEATWKSLERGEYDWAHLAYEIWPDRVRDKCKADRSLAIAHGLEEFCKVEMTPKKKRRKKSGE